MTLARDGSEFFFVFLYDKSKEEENFLEMVQSIVEKGPG